MPRFFENEFATYLIQGDLLHITYHQGATIDYLGAIKVVTDRLALQEGLGYRVLCDIRGLVGVDKAGRDYLALEGSTLIEAVAYVIEPTVSKALSDFYHSINSPPIPSKSFFEVERAVKYLNDFK